MPPKTKPKPKPTTATLPPTLPIANAPRAFDLEKETHATLQRAFDLIEGKGWASGAHCLDARGNKVHHTDNVAKFDLYGAIMLAARRKEYTAHQKDRIEALAFALLKAEMPGEMRHRGIVSFNILCQNVNQILDLLRYAAQQIGTPLEERNAVL